MRTEYAARRGRDIRRNHPLCCLCALEALRGWSASRDWLPLYFPFLCSFARPGRTGFLNKCINRVPRVALLDRTFGTGRGLIVTKLFTRVEPVALGRAD